MRNKLFSFAITLLFLALHVGSFVTEASVILQQEEWVPYVPTADQVRLDYWVENGTSYMNVSIEFADSGYEVTDWGIPIITGNNISVDAEVWQWTGVDFPWVMILSHTYNLGSLSAGEYLFTFKAWGRCVKSVTIVVNTKVRAVIDVNPKALNLRGGGIWFTAYIELLEGYNVDDINVSSVLLNDTISAELSPTAIGDYDNDAVPDLMVKFNRFKVVMYIIANVNVTELFEERFMTVTLTITGYLYNGTSFEGSDTIKIILPMLRGCIVFPIPI